MRARSGILGGNESKTPTGIPYTKVTWFPDYKRFGLKGMTDDIWNHLQKRAYDIAGVTNKSMKHMANDDHGGP